MKENKMRKKKKTIKAHECAFACICGGGRGDNAWSY